MFATGCRQLRSRAGAEGAVESEMLLNTVWATTFGSCSSDS